VQTEGMSKEFGKNLYLKPQYVATHCLELREKDENRKGVMRIWGTDSKNKARERNGIILLKRLMKKEANGKDMK
jgi:hypothetical protein